MNTEPDISSLDFNRGSGVIVDYTPPRPMRCKKCNSENIVFVKKTFSDGRCGIKAYCADCGSDNNWVPMEDNLKKRVNSPLLGWAYKVKKRDGFKCVICGSDEDIQAHHIIPVFFSEEHKYDIGNGVTLCKKCHKAVHGSYREYAGERKVSI